MLLVELSIHSVHLDMQSSNLLLTDAARFAGGKRFIHLGTSPVGTCVGSYDLNARLFKIIVLFIRHSVMAVVVNRHRPHLGGLGIKLASIFV